MMILYTFTPQPNEIKTVRKTEKYTIKTYTISPVLQTQLMLHSLHIALILLLEVNKKIKKKILTKNKLCDVDISKLNRT